MQNERSGWAAAVGTQYKMRCGRLAAITEYRVYYAAPGSDQAAFRRAGINEILEGSTVADPKMGFEWNEQGICVNGDCGGGPQYDLIEAIRGGK